MSQLHLPMFPSLAAIIEVLAFGKQDGGVKYFSTQLPVVSHAEDDVAVFRMITSQFCVQGCVKQSDIIRACGATSIIVKRSVNAYREIRRDERVAPEVLRSIIHDHHPALEPLGRSEPAAEQRTAWHGRHDHSTTTCRGCRPAATWHITPAEFPEQSPCPSSRG